jgi:hypothetical protein
MPRKRAPGAGRKPAGPISGKLANFSTRITQETRVALDAAAAESGQSISQVAERMIRLGLNTAAEREQSNPTQGLNKLIARLAEGCSVNLGDTAFPWNTDSFSFDALAFTMQLLLERLRPADSALSRYLIEHKDVDELDREMLESPEEWAKHVFKAVWDEVTGVGKFELTEDPWTILARLKKKEFATDPLLNLMLRDEIEWEKLRRDLNIKRGKRRPTIKVQLDSKGNVRLEREGEDQ